MTFDELAFAIRSYTIRDDLTDAQIANFVGLFESKLRTMVGRHRFAEVIADVTASVTTGAVELPADFKELRSIQHENNPLALTSVEARTKEKGTPCAYFISGSRIVLVPPPASSGKCSLVYYSHVPPLTSANQSNWLAASFPDVYLHGALAEAYTWFGDDLRLAQAKALLAEALAGVSEDHRRAAFSGGALPIPAGL